MAAMKLGDQAVGSIVKLKVGGTLRDFIVVHQGKPSSIYDDSCNGTWLLIKDCYENRQWNSSKVNTLESSTIHSYLNSTFLNLIDANIRAQIKQVKIPYRKNGGSGGTNQRGANGLSCQVFLLSGYEVGWTTSRSQYFPVDGAKLAYFASGDDTTARNKRIANLNGSAVYWWLRSPYTHSTGYAWHVSASGDCSNLNVASYSIGIRPALVLPATLAVDDDGNVLANTAPATPASITIPESIQGGTSIAVSWSAASDAEDNLEGYVVERSTDGGGTWAQVYQGNATSTTNTVPLGSETVMYRVKAYDSQGLYSGYRNSAQVSVFNNNAPAAPGSITVPEDVLGGASLTVAWSAASDPDGNLTGYELERQVDGGEWERIYKGADTSYTDSITRGWSSVSYRVRSYDAYDAASAYTTGTVRAVNNNRAPAINCDQATGTDLGTKTADFSITYSVGDEDGDPVAVTEAIDGVALRTFTATAGAENTFDVTGDTFFKLLNGARLLTITASDGQVMAVHKLTLTKEVTEASVTLKEPFAADDKITICVLSVQGSIPEDAEYKVEVTNNANDGDATVWEDCTAEVRNGGNHIFTNETAANGFAFNFRVHVKRGPSGVGGYINSVQGGFQ